MNLRGLHPDLMAKFAEDAGLPSSDFPRLLAEAVVNLIQTTGKSDIVERVVPEQEVQEERTWKTTYKFRKTEE
ncbi:hypothetical protein FHT44_005122 [Mycolicibacterium sp. BK634]|uniref:hypothetical protein n=1 Tax=Mycolicibacterium sp. BK634 TaxID=2587099 RepID=UPI00160EA69C|nr:hypothetical protein [Mycolicibacterium sp. BK634]MBB3752610.1 hypothetical protein [Mycolicibacterium sp. BK634]